MTITRRVTTSFLQAIPQHIKHFDAEAYIVVRRKPDKEVPDHPWGTDVRLDPCTFNWNAQTITITVPEDINYGIHDWNDLDPDFYEMVQASFLMLMG